MAEDKQPPGIVEGATTGDVEDELQDDKAKSAEDRKAAAALSKLDARDDDVSGTASVDQEGLSQAMNKLSVAKTTASADVKKVKVDAADVTLLVSKQDTPRVCRGERQGERNWNWRKAGAGGSFRSSEVNHGANVVDTQVDQLELTKAKATELLKQHDGDAVKAMSAFIAVS